MFQIIQDLIGNAVVSSGVSYEALCAILISSLFVIMIIGLVAGQELAFVLGGAGIIIGVIAWGGSGLNIAATKIYDQMQSYSMVAIPMFVLMANFLTHSKVADGLFLSIRYLLGPLKGGLGLAVIVVSTIFAATTGIVGASVVTMGMLSMPILLKCGYDHRLAAGMVCAGGSLGILIPPSIMLVTMGSYAEVSVGKLFFAALIPGLLLAACYAIYIIIICHIHPEYGPAMSGGGTGRNALEAAHCWISCQPDPPAAADSGCAGFHFLRHCHTYRGRWRRRSGGADSGHLLQAVQLENAV